MKHLKILFLLLAAFLINFTYQNGWRDAQAPGDDPVYVQSAYDYWQKGTPPGAITWSPGYVALMSPVVGLLGKEVGYKTWRFAIFFGASVLTYFAFLRMFGSAWLGLVVALYSQMFILPYIAPSLQTLLSLLYLACFALLTSKARYLGFVFAILMNSIFVSGAAGTVLAVFGMLCLIFYLRVVFSVRFVAQVLVGVALFAVVLHHFKYDIASYSEEASLRGRAGLYHQLSLYILSSGRSVPYLQAGDIDPHQPPVDEYHQHLKAIDRYYVDKFGNREAELRASSQDARWPVFLLDWPWLMEKDPELMREYGREVIRALVEDSALTVFEAIRPYDTAPSMKRGLRNLYAILVVLFIIVLPLLVLRGSRVAALSNISMPSRLQVLFAFSCFLALIPLMLVKPLPIYFPPLIPVYLFVLGILAAGIVRKLERILWKAPAVQGRHLS